MSKPYRYKYVLFASCANSTFLYRLGLIISCKVSLPGKNLLPGGEDPYRLVVTLFGAEPLVDLVAVGTFSLGSWSLSVGGSAMKGGRTNTTLGMGASFRLTFLTWGNFFWALEEPNTRFGRVLFF